MPDEFYAGMEPETANAIDEEYDEGILTVGFSDKYNEPLFAAEILTPEEAETHIKRCFGFHQDKYVTKDHRISLKVYHGTGFDEGHLVPAADSKNKEEMHETFTSINIVPEVPEMNRGIWGDIEEKVRSLAKQYGKLYVVTGAVFNGYTRIMNGLAVPPFVYKSVTIPSLKLKGDYVCPNNKSGKYEIMSAPDFFKKFGIKPQPGNHFHCDKSIFEL